MYIYIQFPPEEEQIFDLTLEFDSGLEIQTEEFSTSKTQDMHEKLTISVESIKRLI